MLQEAEFVALTLAAKEATWLRLLLTELGLLGTSEQYAEIKVAQGSTGTKQILADIRGQEEEAIPLMAQHSETETALHSKTDTAHTMEEALPSETAMSTITNTPPSLKGDNQGSIALAHNPVFHARTKHVDIQHHYIRDEVAAGRIDLQYIPTSEMIADGMTKALTHTKFHLFVKQLRMT